MTVNRACSSGLESINLAVQSIMTGESDIVVAGGADNMSQSPYLMGNRFEGPRMGDVTMTDGVSISSVRSDEVTAPDRSLAATSPIV